MNALDVISLQPGTALDEAVSTIVYGNPVAVEPLTVPSYSLDESLAIRLIEKCNLFIARIEPPTNREKPFLAGQLAHSESGQMDHTILRVSAPTMAIALCKAALLVTLKRAAEKANAPVPESAESIVARAGTRLARNRAAKLPAPVKPSPTGYKGKKALRLAAERDAKKAAKLAAPKKVAIEQVPTGPSQPRAFIRNRANLLPIPKRKEIVMPENAK